MLAVPLRQAVSLRQYRQESIAVAVGLAAVAVLAVVTGAMMSGQYHSSGLAECLASRPRQDCGDLIDLFDTRYNSLQVLVVPLVLLPALVGAFLGAPLVARELEAGTHRFLWTQALTPRQWLVTASAHLLALSLVAGGAYAGISAWWLDLPNRLTGDRFDAMYDLQGLVPVAATVFALAVGIACGVLVRRTVPAMAATFGLFVAVRLSVALLLRPRLASPSTISVPFGSANPLNGTGAWQLTNTTVADDGLVLGHDGSVDLTAVADRCPGIPTDPGRGLPDFDSIQRCVADLDIRTVISYQPGDRFWTFQLIESGFLIALAAALFGLAVSILRRRAA